MASGGRADWLAVVANAVEGRLFSMVLVNGGKAISREGGGEEGKREESTEDGGNGEGCCEDCWLLSTFISC